MPTWNGAQQLLFNNGDRSMYQEVKTERDALETAVGSELTWEDLPRRKASRISLYRTGSIERVDEYSAYVDWFIDSQNQLRSAVERVLNEREKVR